MKIVLYFSAAFGLFWLIHGVLSHRDPAKRNYIQHSNANKDRGEYLSSESASVQDKVLIKSESPLRGRKIHQTAWSKEESDGEKDQVMKPSGPKKNAGAENSWALEKILKYLSSLVYSMEETEQPTNIWITSEYIDDKSQANSNTKIKQKSTQTDNESTYEISKSTQTDNESTDEISKSTQTDNESTDEISKSTQKNPRREHSSTYKNNYLEDYYETFYREGKSDKNYEDNEAYENSFEYENLDEEEDDESHINYKTNTKKYQNVKSNHLFQDEEEYESNPILMKLHESSSLQDFESTDSEDCFEDVDVNLKQNSQEIENIEEFNEENNYLNKQVTEKKYEGLRNKLRNRTKKDGPTGKESHKIIVLNGTKFTGQNGESNKNEGPLETTSFSRQTTIVELLDTENKVNEESEEEVSINERGQPQGDSYVVGETVQTKSNNENIQITSDSQNTKDELTDSVIIRSVLNNSNDTGGKETNSVKKSKPINKQQENETNFTETMQTVYSNDDNLKNEVMTTKKTQNEETLMTTSTNNIAQQNHDENTVTTLEVNPDTLTDVTRQEYMQTINNVKVQNDETIIMTSAINDIDKLNLSENTVTTLGVNPNTLTEVTRQENMQTINNEKVQNDETIIMTSAINNIDKLNLGENTVTTLEVNPNTLTDVARQENMQTINNEKVQNDEKIIMTSSINNIAELNLDQNNVNKLEVNQETLTDLIRQENMQTINNEETINKPVETLTIIINNTELNNEENKDFDVQNKTPEFKISEIQIVEGNQDEFSQHQTSQISVTENNQQNYEYLNKNINKVNETLLISKDDNDFENILGGNEFVPSSPYNEEISIGLKNNRMAFNKNEYENNLQLFTELQNAGELDHEQQESFDTILEYMYKHSKNPLILSLKENSNTTN